MRLELIENKLVARFSYNQSYIDRLHNVPGARYAPKYKIGNQGTWLINKDIPTVNSFIVNFPMAWVDPKIKAWMDEFHQQADLNMEQKKHGDYTDINPATFPFKTKPYQHQVKALDLIMANKNYALCMEMGTGKTKPIIDYLSYLKRKTGSVHALIVAPLSVVPNWKAECSKHADNLNVSLLVGSRAERIEALETPADVYVINYAGMRVMYKYLDQYWDMMVCDESQNIKNRTSIQSKICCGIGTLSDRRYILTGTLVTNKPLDVYGQFKFLNEDILGRNYFSFQSRYAIMVVSGRARFPVKFINIDELSQKLAPWNYRVLKKNCLDLPPKTYETRYIELSPEAKSLYKKIKDELAVILDSGTVVTAPIILTKLLRFSQITAGFISTEDKEIVEVGKREKTKALVEVIQEAAGKVVVWVRFHKEMEMVKDTLTRSGIRFVSLSGRDHPNERQEAIQRFHDDDVVKVFIGQIEAGGTGINLTAGNVCVYMTNSYSLGTRLQSEDRLHRIGQVSAVTYVDIVAPGTIDTKILKMLRDKKDIADIINQDKIMEELV